MTEKTEAKVGDARHFISNVLVDEMHRYHNGEVSKENFSYLINALERQSFLPNHPAFFESVRKLAFGIHDDE